MRTISKSILLLIFLLSLVQSPGPFLSYDPSNGDGSATITLIKESDDIYSWFHKVTATSPSVIFKMTVFDRTDPNKKKTVTYTPTNDNTVKSLSGSLNCALLFDNIASPNTMSALIFNPSSATATLKSQIIADGLIAASDASKTFTVADLCTAIKIDANIYHYTVSVGYQPDTVPAWDNPVLSNDFSYAAAADGVYKYDSVGKSYSKIYSGTFYLNKKLWQTDSKLIVFSWADSTTLGQTNLKNYKIQAFSISGNTLTQAALIQGKSFDTTSNVGPFISVSSTLQTLVVYGQASAGVLFYSGKKIDYTANTAVNLEFPELINGTASYVTVSDVFVYARNKVNKVGTSLKFHGGYQIFGSKLTKYFQIALDPSQITLWTRSLIFDFSSKQLLVFRQHIQIGVIRLEQENHPLEGQILRWDKTNIGANTITGAGTSFSQSPAGPAWFLEAVISGGKKYTSVYLHPTANNQIYVSLSTTSTSSLKVVSANKKCAIIYDSAGPSLKSYNFNKPGTASITEADGVLIAASTYSGIDITTLAGNLWQVSDDCNALRIGQKVMHWDNSTTNYIVDTFPSGITLNNPIFGTQFNFVVTDDAIYHWVRPASAGTAGSYVFDRIETFNPIRKVWRNQNNILIFTQKETTAGSGKYDWKLQYNSVVNSTISSFGQVVGRSTDIPIISVSQKCTIAVVFGKSFDDATKPFYVAKNIDYLSKKDKNINLPEQITSVANQIIVTDDLLYAKNKQGIMKHYGYLIMGTKLVNQFNQNFPLPLTVDYSQTVIIPDVINNRMILACQLNPNDWIRLVKNQKKSAAQIINPNKVSPYQMTFTYELTGSFKRQTSPKFSKWLFTTETGTKLNFIQYDPNVNDTKKRSFQKSPLSTGNNAILDVSDDLDCALTLVTGSALDTVQIFPSNNTMSIINAYSTVISDFNTAANISLTISQRKYRVGPGCWAFRLGGLIYYRNSTNDGYAKSTASATPAYANAVYDRTLKFALVGDTVYKFETNDYISKFSVSGINSTRQIYVSADQNKLIIVSWQPVPVSAGVSTKMSGIAKMYVNNGTFWNEFPKNIQFNRFQTSYTFESSPNFQTIGFVFYNSTPSRFVRPVVTYYQINYTTNVADQYQTLPQFQQIQVGQTFVIFKNYLYYLKFDVANNAYTQYFYKFDPMNKKIAQIGRNKVDASFSQSLKGGQIFQQNNNLYALFEVQQPGGNIVVMKRLIGNVGLQTMIKGIQTLQSGVVIVNDTVLLCISGCSNCVNPTSCISCFDGFVLDSNNFCTRCVKPCKSCTTDALDTCLSCFSGFYLSSGTCIRCHDSCLTCSSSAADNMCTSCKVGFYIDSATDTGACAPCIEDCVKCSKQIAATDALCEVCKLGSVYHPTVKKCIKCISGCFNCKYNKIHQCQKCGDGFQSIFVNGVLTQCKKCPQNCRTCAGQNNCTDCRQGFRPLNGSCVEQCKLPCRQCLLTNSSACTKCIGGFILQNQDCKPDFSCNTTSNCSSCPLGFNLISGNCFKCNGGDNCRTCQNTNIEKCSSCIKGFYLTQTKNCTPCTAVGCAHCRDQVFCLQCKPGYTLSGSSQSSQCIQCHQSCKTCFQQPTNCDECAENYTKRGWKCTTTSNVRFSFRINADFQAVTTQQYMALQDDICAKVNKSSSQINIEQLRSGSIEIQGTIDISSGGDQSNVINSLATAYGSGTNIGGFTIESSSFIAQDFSVVPPPDNDNENKMRILAICLGVILPSVTIITMIVLFILYKKGIICKRPNQQISDMKETSNVNFQNVASNQLVELKN